LLLRITQEKLNLSEIIWQPAPGPQTVFLASTAREVLYGGAAGGGKSDALLACCLRFADHPKHRAILLRRTRPQLQESIDRSLQLYPAIVPGAAWREAESRWRMPSGAIVQMGYAEHEKDIFNFKTFEYNLVAFDELTSFTETQYKFMFLRNRTKSPDLPLWLRSGTNPEDIGHWWVFERFIQNKTPYQVYATTQEFQDKKLTITRQFIPSRVWDNPYLPNRDDYIRGILEMGEDAVRAYLHGEWTQLAGAMFREPLTDVAPGFRSPSYYVIRSIDFGISDPTCVLWLSVYPDNSMDVIGELYLQDTNVDAVAHHVRAFENDMQIKPVISVGSPEMGQREATSEQSIWTMLNQRGVWGDRGNTDRIGGWAQIQRLTHAKQLRVWVGKAPNLVRTLGIMQRAARPSNPNDLAKHQEDHAVDALRYAVMAVWEQQGSKKPVANEPAPVAQGLVRDTQFDKLVARIRKDQQGIQIPQLGEWS